MPARLTWPRPPDGDGAVIAGPALLAGGLSLIGVTGRSLGFDEGATWAIVTQHGAGHGLGAGITRDGGNMTAYYALMHVLVRAFGDSLWVLRLPSVLATALTAGLVAAIGLRLFERRVALLGAVLTAVSLPIVYWGQTARSYALMLAFTCAGMLAFVVLACSDERDLSRSPWPAAVGYAIAMVVACYCSFVAVLVVPVQLVALVHRRRAWRPFATALTALAICCLPLVVLAARRGTAQLFWVPSPSRQVETQVLETLTGSGLQSSFHAVATTTAGWIATVLALIACGVTVVRARRVPAVDAGVAARGSGPALVLIWAVLPGALTFLYSLVAHPIFVPRNLLICTPAVALAIALVICDRRLPAWAAAVGVVLALAIRVVPLAAAVDVSPEPWAAATHAVRSGARPGDCVAFYPEDGHNAYAYYARDAGPRSVLPPIAAGVTHSYVERYATLSAAQLARLRGSCTRLWLVWSHQGQVHGPPQSRRNLAGLDALRARVQAAFGRGPVHQYGYASAIYVELAPGR